MASSSAGSVPVLDLRGMACPANFVKAKMRLAQLSSGERLVILLDDGEPMDRVPASLAMDGHEILSEEMLAAGAAWKIIVQRV